MASRLRPRVLPQQPEGRQKDFNQWMKLPPKDLGGPPTRNRTNRLNQEAAQKGAQELWKNAGKKGKPARGVIYHKQGDASYGNEFHPRTQKVGESMPKGRIPQNPPDLRKYDPRIGGEDHSSLQQPRQFDTRSILQTAQEMVRRVAQELLGVGTAKAQSMPRTQYQLNTLGMGETYKQPRTDEQNWTHNENVRRKAVSMGYDRDFGIDPAKNYEKALKRAGYDKPPDNMSFMDFQEHGGELYYLPTKRPPKPQPQSGGLNTYTTRPNR